MTDSARYVKIVEWSEEDQAFVGQCSGIIGPCCHGTDESEVYRDLCQIVDEWIEIASATAGRCRLLPPAGIAQNACLDLQATGVTRARC